MDCGNAPTYRMYALLGTTVRRRPIQKLLTKNRPCDSVVVNISAVDSKSSSKQKLYEFCCNKTFCYTFLPLLTIQDVVCKGMICMD